MGRLKRLLAKLKRPVFYCAGGSKQISANVAFKAASVWKCVKYVVKNVVYRESPGPIELTGTCIP